MPLHADPRMRPLVKLESCQYFNETGKCAFGPGCRKEHNANLLTASAQSNLRRDNSEHRQQLTLHLASIPDGYQEADIIKDFSPFGALQSVNICRKTSLVETNKYWRNGFVTFSCEKEALHVRVFALGFACFHFVLFHFLSLICLCRRPRQPSTKTGHRCGLGSLSLRKKSQSPLSSPKCTMLCCRGLRQQLPCPKSSVCLETSCSSDLLIEKDGC